MYEPRTYRSQFNNQRFRSFHVVYKETDLWIGIDFSSYLPEIEKVANEKVIELRIQLENYIKTDPDFGTSLKPHLTKEGCPDIAVQMADAATKAGIGPMSAVAGLFAQKVGEEILQNFSVDELVIENGGDIYAKLKSKLTLSVYAGDSPLSEKIGVIIPPDITPVGVCTSAGKVGPSLSFGNADAVMVVSKNIGLADSLATAFGNDLKTEKDMNKVLDHSETFPEIYAFVVIIDGKLGIKSILETKLLK